MLGNRTLLQKADVALSDLVSNGGYLQPAQAKKFIVKMARKQKLLGMITMVPLKSPNQVKDKIDLTGQVLQPGVSGEALAVAQRTAPTFEQDAWDAKLFKAEVRIPAEVLEDNIESQGLRNTIMRLATEGVGRDTEKVAIQGDTSSSTPLLAQLDGFLVQSTSNALAQSQARADKPMLRQMVRAMPKQYIDDKSKMKFFTSINAEDDYSDYYAPRATQLGDTVQTTQWKAVYKGVEVVPVPLFPEDLGGGSNETNILLSLPKNMEIGMWRKIKVKTGEDISADVLVLVLSLRFDAQFLEEEATVRSYEVLNS